MRLVHLADLHLGYRAYGKTTDQGFNLREQDVANAFKQAVTKVIELAPDLVVVAGDIFHAFRPSNANITLAFREFARLAEGLRGRPVVIVAGNHDLPRATDTGSILRLFNFIEGCQVIDQAPKTLVFPGLDCAVTGVPSQHLGQMASASIRPDSNCRYNVLVLHGTIEGVMKHAHDPVIVSKKDLLADRWDYIALGHYHRRTEVAPHCWYAGSTEYASSNIWEEATDEKGFLEADLASGDVRFHPLAVREVVDLAPLDGTGLEAAQIDQLIAERIASLQGIWGKVVRLVVTDVPKPVQRQLNYRQIRQWRSEAVHLDIRVTAPKQGVQDAEVASGEARGLKHTWAQFLEEGPLYPGLERDVLVSKGLHYFGRVTGDAP